MKGSVRSVRHRREVRGRVGRGVRGEDAGSKRLDESQDEEKLDKCGAGDKKKKKKTGSREESCAANRHGTRQNKRVTVLSYRSCTRCNLNLLNKITKDTKIQRHLLGLPHSHIEIKY